MGRKLAAMVLLFAAAAGISGCWSKLELTERGFVMTAAIDSLPSGSIRGSSVSWGSSTASPASSSFCWRCQAKISASFAAVFT